ncbi:MAG: hypothetical protein Q4B54_07680 [Coriobacteriales bacterium]|nr:hypothetical protein [Coriobacteriales bacterium]
MAKRNLDKSPFHQKSYLEHRLQHNVLKDGVAHIPCKISGVEDVVSRFSIKGCESLDSEFAQYVAEFVDFIPTEYPIVLDLYGPALTPEEQKTILATIREDLTYYNGKMQDISRRRKKTFTIMIVGAILSGVLLELAILYAPDVPKEWSFVVFWLFADAVLRYLFVEQRDFKQERICAERLAKLSVEFKLSEES